MSGHLNNPSKVPVVSSPQESPKSPMEALPPEILSIILKFVLNEEDYLNYRLVHSEWKKAIDSLVEMKIVSGRLDPFPYMRLITAEGLLYAQASPTTYRDGLPFNSLLLLGGCEALDVVRFEEVPRNFIDFMGFHGSNLTSFGLYNTPMDASSLSEILRLTPNLKLLSVKLMIEDFDESTHFVAPIPPPLPSLVALELMSGWYKSACALNNKCQSIYIWLIASYADQLTLLKIETRDGLPALKKSHQYFDTCTGENILIATTSDSAFGKLKHFQTTRRSMEFLALSDATVLSRLEIVG